MPIYKYDVVSTIISILRLKCVIILPIYTYGTIVLKNNLIPREHAHAVEN